MLIEIRSSVLRKGSIRLHSGLNVVLGDENGTNSIGKSSFLMILDFALGGTSFVSFSRDVVRELGHHEYFFSFLIDGEARIFRRGTDSPNVVFVCDSSGQSTSSMTADEYRALLRAFYWKDLDGATFRSVVGLYSRVWGKENLEVSRPLHPVPRRSDADCVSQLIKTFGMYSTLSSLAQQVSEASRRVDAYVRAFRDGVLPKISKKKYRENSREIERIEREIGDIKRSLAQYAVSISEVMNKEVLEFKAQKDRLLSIRESLKNRRFRRARVNLNVD